MQEEVCLAPAMPGSSGPTWPGATWIGAVDRPALRRSPAGLRLAGGAGFARGRLVVREDGLTLGTVELPVVDGRIDPVAALAAAESLPSRSPVDLASDARAPSVTVTVSTRNRAANLEAVLESLAASELREVAFLIVDNASDDRLTEKVVAGFGDDRFSCVREDRPGLSYGRNRALLDADTDIVAFTDDDVLVDPGWIGHLVEAFRRDADVALVTGMVPTGELRTPAQQYFEQQTGWQSRCVPRTYRLAEPPQDIPGFPLDVGRYGTGANFAVRRDIAIRLGGFNEALGIGSPTHGGEDLDMFLRVLYGGWALAYSPDSLVWHRHRADAESLERAVVGYSVSFTAWMSSLVENPKIRRDAVRIGVQHAGRRIRQIARDRFDRREGKVPPTQEFSLIAHGFAHLPRLGLRAMADGPTAYISSRRGGRRIRPLLGQPIGPAR